MQLLDLHPFSVGRSWKTCRSLSHCKTCGICYIYCSCHIDIFFRSQHGLFYAWNWGAVRIANARRRRQRCDVELLFCIRSALKFRHCFQNFHVCRAIWSGCADRIRRRQWHRSNAPFLERNTSLLNKKTRKIRAICINKNLRQRLQSSNTNKMLSYRRETDRKPVFDFLLVINSNWHLSRTVSELSQLIV